MMSNLFHRRSATALAAIVLLSVCTRLSAQYQGWLIPAGGKEEKSPVAASSEAVRRGAALFSDHCARCHGAGGTGNGKDSTRAADLTDELRSDLNTEGVLFYKIWNGHSIQLRTEVEDMPAFRDKLTRAQIWDIVEHLKVLRTPR